MSTVEPTGNRATRRRLGRGGSLVGLSMLATTGMLGANLGSPRLSRAYAATPCFASSITTASGLNSAIAAFNSGGCDTITLGANITLAGTPTPISHASALTIDGGGFTITGNPGGNGFTADLSGALLTVQDTTFTTFSNTAILSTTNGTNVTITDSVFRLGQQGALYAEAGAITISGSVFDQNGADVPALGAVGLAQVKSLTVTNSTFTKNSGAFTGALGFYGKVTQPVTVSNSYFGQNTGKYAGAAVTQIGGASEPLQISNSTFAGNTSLVGAAVASLGPTTVVNSTFSGNTAAQLGGAIISGAATISFSTFSGNTATAAKGGNALYVPYGATIANSIITGTASSYDIHGTSVTASHSSLRQGSLWTGSAASAFATDGVNGNQVGQNPQLGALGDNGGFLIAGSTTAHIPTMAPAAGSPVVNAATFNAGTDPATDERGAGFPRSSGPAADMGAVERQQAAIAYTGATAVTVGAKLAVSATITPSGCTAAPVYSLNRNPVTGASGAYTITGPSVSTTKWRAGTYTLTASVPATSGCTAASTTATVTVSKGRVPLKVSAASTATHPVPGSPIRLVSGVSTPGRYSVVVRCATTGISTAGDRRNCAWTRNASTGAITVTTRRGLKVKVRITIVSYPNSSYPSTGYNASSWTRTWTSR